MFRLTFVQYYWLNYRPFSLSTSFSPSVFFFPVLVSNSGFHTALQRYIYLLSSNLQQILSLVFYDLDIFDEYWSFFCRMFLGMDLSDVFSLSNIITFLGSKDIIEVMLCPSQCIILRGVHDIHKLYYWWSLPWSLG